MQDGSSLFLDLDEVAAAQVSEETLDEVSDADVCALAVEEADDLLTHVNGSSLFLERGVSYTNQVFDVMPHKVMVWDEEILSNLGAHDGLLQQSRTRWTVCGYIEEEVGC